MPSGVYTTRYYSGFLRSRGGKYTIIGCVQLTLAVNVIVDCHVCTDKIKLLTPQANHIQNVVPSHSGQGINICFVVCSYTGTGDRRNPSKGRNPPLSPGP
jgi:hypothetical protein